MRSARSRPILTTALVFAAAGFSSAGRPEHPNCLGSGRPKATPFGSLGRPASREPEATPAIEAGPVSPFDGLWGSDEAGGPYALPRQWSLVLRAALDDPGFRPGTLDDWRNDDPRKQIFNVQRDWNRCRYRRDPPQEDLKTPDRMRKEGGDCEDYAIAKYAMLRALGWPAESLRIVVVDMKGDTDHAVLVAATGGKLWVLDNRYKAAWEPKNLKGYVPLQSLNENGSWQFRARKPSPAN